MSASYFHVAAMEVEENWNEIYDYNSMFFYSVLYCVILLELEISIYFSFASSQFSS